MINHSVPIVLLDYSRRNALLVINQSRVKFAKAIFRKMIDEMSLIGSGGTRYISFEDRHWHNDCFVCQRCRGSLVGRGFLTEGPEILCPDCGKREQFHQAENASYSGGQRSIVNDYHKTN